MNHITEILVIPYPMSSDGHIWESSLRVFLSCFPWKSILSPILLYACRGSLTKALRNCELSWEEYFDGNQLHLRFFTNAASIMTEMSEHLHGPSGCFFCNTKEQILLCEKIISVCGDRDEVSSPKSIKMLIWISWALPVLITFSVLILAFSSFGDGG